MKSDAENYANWIIKQTHKSLITPFRLEEYCFDKQLEFIKDPAKFKTAVCSRRAGKTVACAADLTYSAVTNKKVVCLYITLSRLNAKKIIWPELNDINQRFNLGGKVNESELSITYPNKSTIYLSGAKDQKEIEKFRGLALFKVYIDESQSFRPYIENLVEDVISKALFDYDGTLCLTGTPGPVPAGFFHSASQNKEWAHYHWTMLDNPWLERKSGKSPKELIEQDIKRKGVTINDPTIQRECFGKWVIDTDALVIKYEATRNHFDAIPDSPLAWRFIIGVDLGYDDSDAIAVLGYNERFNAAYLFEEKVQDKQGITELVAQISDLYARYRPDKIVMDTAGLGKKIAEEITRRYMIMIEPADKARKFEFIELLNDALRTKRLFAKKTSRFAQDSMVLEWERDLDKITEKPKIKDSFHSDIIDAVLYAFKDSYHWLHEPLEPKVLPGSDKWLEKQVKEMEDAALEHLQRTKETDPWAAGFSAWED